MNKIVKTNARRDERAFVDQLAQEEEANGAFSPFFNEVWEREEIPEDWRKGLILKIPKKGDISVCDNSRGINLILL